MSRTITREELCQVVEAYEKALGNKQKAADLLGIPVSTFKYWYNRAVQQGLTGDILYGPALEGYEFTEISTQVDAKGNPECEWSRQNPIPPTGETIPVGHVVKGLSTLVDRDGRQIAQWIKTREGEMAPVDLIKLVKDELVDMTPLPKVPFTHCPETPETARWEVFFPVVDDHLGMYAWAKETGQNYDLDIASDALLGTGDRMIVEAPPAAVAWFIGLGDFFHIDNYENRTPHSGNPLDGDSRYPKVLALGIKLWKILINDALQKYPSVKVRILPGNHDRKGAIILSLCLAEAFSDNPRVEIDTDPSYMWFHKYGVNMFGATHGDMVQPKDFIHKMAAIKPQMWGQTQFRYSWHGHLHRWEKGPRGLEADGAQYEIFEAITARDAWNAEKGFTSNRSMQWRAYSKDGDWKTGGVYIRSC